MSETIAESRPCQLPSSRSNIKDQYQIIPLQWLGYDVTDNKTDLQYKFQDILMDERYQREDERLKTFEHWPLQWLNKRELAQTGLFYTGEDDKVKCYFCEVEIGRWEPNDQPLSEHLRFSPNCPLLRRRTTNNVPLNAVALSSILPPVSYDVCGNEENEVRPGSYSEGTIPEELMRDGTSFSGAPTQPYRPKYPEYAIESARVRSFAEWPRNMKQKPQQLAEAGFFYTGTGDRVKCFSCGCGLKDWDDGDDPWEQHALWMSKCRYLNLIKGQTYIDSVVAKLKPSNDNAPVPPSSKPLNGLICPQRSNTIATVSVVGGGGGGSGIASVCITECCVQPTETQAQEPPSTSGAGEINAKQQKQKQHQHNIAEEKLCKICYADEYNTAFQPCGHVVACAKCASSVTKCPVCREPFTNVMRVFFS